MAYTNSSLVDCTVKSPNHSGPRTEKRITRITPHCVVGQLSAERIGDCFDSTSKQASCNYGIGTEGRVVLVVDEGNRSWCTSSNSNDQKAVTIECASDKTEPYTFNNTVYNKLIDLCVDICKRNGAKRLLWLKTKEATLNYAVKDDEMVLTVHRWFKNKSCPGNWMFSRMGDLADKVTARLGGKEKDVVYRVRKTWADVASQIGAYTDLDNAKAACKAGYSVFDENGKVVYAVAAPTSTTKPASSSTNSSFPRVPFSVEVLINDLVYRDKPSNSGAKKGNTGKGIFNITQVSDKWGKLKSGAGWIYLGNPAYVKIGKTVNSEFKVQVTASGLNVRKGAGTNYKVTAIIRDKGIYTITETKNGWGKLKSGIGWINLDYTKRV